MVKAASVEEVVDSLVAINPEVSVVVLLPCSYKEDTAGAAAALQERFNAAGVSVTVEVDAPDSRNRRGGAFDWGARLPGC